MSHEVTILVPMERQPDKDAYSGDYSYQGTTIRVLVSGLELKRLKEDCGCGADRIAQEAIKWIGVQEDEGEATIRLPEDLGSKRKAFVEHVKSSLKN